MEKIFEIASSISTPLALGGFFAAAVFYVFRQIVAKNVFPQLSVALGADVLKLIIERLFILALVAMVLGFVGYLVTNIVPLPTPSVTGSRSSKVRVAGEWQADVVYAWNTGTPGNIINERFSLTTDDSGQNIQGSVSLLGKSYVVHDGKVDGNSVTFKTNGRESRGTGEPPLDVTYQYRGTVAGDTMSVTIFTEGSISNYSPVIKFVARRAQVTKQ